MPMTILEQHYQMVQHLDNAIKLELIAKLQQDIQQKPANKPLNDLSKLVAHQNVVNGNSDDLVHLNWEKELQLDLPQ